MFNKTKELKFEELYFGRIVCDKDDMVGTVIDCNDIHNIIVKAENSEFNNMYCLDPNCEEKEYYDLLFGEIEDLNVIDWDEPYEEVDDGLVCVLCGEPWTPFFKNRCECGGFCSWGKEKDGPPSSWNVNEQGEWRPKPPPGETILCPNCKEPVWMFEETALCPKCKNIINRY